LLPLLLSLSLIRQCFIHYAVGDNNVKESKSLKISPLLRMLLLLMNIQ